MVESPEPIRPVEAASKRGRSEIKFPVYSLADCVVVAKAVYEKGGGLATSDHLAAYLGYKSAINGAFIARVAASKMFGLIAGPPQRIELTPLAQKILMPIRDTDSREGLTTAFMGIPLYKAVYEEYHGKELPAEFGLKNALRTRFGVTPQRIDRAYRALMDSAEVAGFFDVRGSRTQLIMPAIQRQPELPADAEPGADDGPEGRSGGGGNGSGNGRPPRTPTQSRKDLQNEYVAALIDVFREKGAKGEVDEALMARIEKLLDLTQ
jgi:hypothetical protein